MNCKGFWRKRLGTNRGNIPEFCLEGLKKTTRSLIPGRDSNRIPFWKRVSSVAVMQILSVHLFVCGYWRFDVTYCIYLTRTILLSFLSSSDLEFMLKQWVTLLYMNTLIRNWICNPHCSRKPRPYEPLWPAETASYSSTFRVRPSGLFPIRINLELWISYTIGRTPWTGDQPCRKATPYAGQHGHRSIAEWDLKPRSRCLNGRRPFMP
jgi:hypothetical protein